MLYRKHLRAATDIYPTSTTTMSTWKAKCQCGKSIVDLPGPPKGLFICHCLECRKQSTSAFGLSAYYDSDSIPQLSTILTLKIYQRPSDSGYRISGYFCENCGSRLAHVNSRGYISVKGGAIEGDQELEWGGATHVYTRSKMPWVIIPEGAKAYEGEIKK